MKNKSDLTFIEACKILKKSRKTISRYIQKGLLKPKEVKSKKGTLKYLFKLNELKNLKNKDRTDKTRQDTISPAIRQDSEVIGLLKDQLNIKDKQIKSLSGKIDKLIERSRETNILLKGLTNKVLMLEGKTGPVKTINELEKEDKIRGDKKDKTGQDIRQDRGQKIKVFFKRLFKGLPRSERWDLQLIKKYTTMLISDKKLNSNREQLTKNRAPLGSKLGEN